MPETSANDIVMRFTYGEKGTPDVAMGDPVLAECALEVDKQDDFMKGFKSADYDSYSNFFEVIKFSFGFNAKEDSSKDEDAGFKQGSALNARGGGTGGAGMGMGMPMAARDADKDRVPGLSGEFKKWRSVKSPEWEKQGFGVDIDTFSFSRLIDRASPTFFMWCANSFTFDRATLVKRIAVGARAGGNSIPQGYLRMDFKNVMLKGVKWSDGDVVTEECEMVFELFKVQYKRQFSNGGLDRAVGADWDREYHTDPNKNDPNKTTRKTPRIIDLKAYGE